jgi:hypothetical protein
VPALVFGCFEVFLTFFKLVLIVAPLPLNEGETAHPDDLGGSLKLIADFVVPSLAGGHFDVFIAIDCNLFKAIVFGGVLEGQLAACFGMHRSAKIKITVLMHLFLFYGFFDLFDIELILSPVYDEICVLILDRTDLVSF